MPRLLSFILTIGLITAEVSNGPLVYPSWPPKSSQPKPMLYHQIASQPSPAQQNRLQSLYQMRLSPSAVSRFPSSSSLLQSPSNMIYTQTKHRQQYQTHTQPPQKQIQSQPHQPKRIVLRQQSPKLHSSPISGSSPYILMSSVKPHHHTSAQHPIGSESHNIYFKQPQSSSSPAMGKQTVSGLKHSQHKTVDYVFENPFATNEGLSLSSIPTVGGGGPYYFQNPTLNSHTIFQLKGNHLVLPSSTSTLLPIGGQQTQHTQHYRLQPNAYNKPQPHVQQNTKPKYNPIHTITAPDLTLLEQKPLSNYINRPIEINHISEKDLLVGAYNSQQRPYSVHQYQVTEPSNDQILREQHAGHQTIYAPHPDISPQSNYQLQQAPSDTFYTPTTYSQGQSYQPAASALVQHQVFPSYTNTAAQQPTGPSLTNNYQQPKPQQHVIYQHQPDMPMAVYNPTYLVTQSNQLLSQHKQHLFKPDPLFVQHQSHKSSGGESEFIPSYQLEQSHSTPDPISHYQNQQISQPLDEPQFARLIAAPPPNQQQHPPSNDAPFPTIKHHHKHSSVLQQRPTLTENEMSNLLNFGRLEGDSSQYQNDNQATGFVASSFMQTEPINTSSGSVLYTNPSFETVLQHQQQNNERIVEATRQAMNNNNNNNHKQSPSSSYHNQAKHHQNTIFVTKSPDQKRQEDIEDSITAQHKDHSNHISGSDLHIYVPDSPADYSPEHGEHFQKRSDHFDSNEADHHQKPTTMDFRSETKSRLDSQPTTDRSVVDEGTTNTESVQDPEISAT